MTPSTGASYLALLHAPGARPAFAAATTVRLSYATVSLALLLAVHDATGSFAIAGAARGAYGAPALLDPLVARLIDRHGRLRIVAPLSVGYGGTLVAITVCACVGVRAIPAYLGLAALAGVLGPPVRPVMRGMWAAIAPTPQARQRAYSLDAVSEEVVFAVGPLLVGLLVTLAGPGAALVATAALALGGSLALAVTAVPAERSTAVARGAGRASSASRPARTAVVEGRRRWWGPLSHRGFRWVALAMLGVGLGLTPLEVAVAARAQETAAPAAAGYLLAGLSAASAAGGLLWGRLGHRRAPTTQLLGLLGALAAGTLAAGLVTSLTALAVVLVLTGFAVAPVFVVAFVLADDVVPPTSRTEASTWVSTAHNLGGAAGAACAGVVIDQQSAQAAFLLGGAVLALTGAALASARRRVPLVVDSDPASHARPTR